MKVLFQSRKTLFSVPGGDTIQILKTREYLERSGVGVDISTELEPDVSRYDVVHLFNLTRPQEVYLQALNAKRQGKKAVLSTIYVSYAEYEKKARRGLGGLLMKVLAPGQMEYLKVAARAVRNGEMNKGTATLLLRGYRSLQRQILAMTDVLLPNSSSERARVIEDFPAASAKKHIIVPNAVDRELFAPGPATLVPADMVKYRGCVLCVARIEELKNQLNLVRAMKQLPWQLVLIGKPAPNHAYYVEQVRKEAGANVHILGEVEHSRLPRFYRAARVHVLPSWMETTGLSSLEAGAMGCNLVITDKGDTREYFGDRAFYCEPDSVDSISAAIKAAYEAPACSGLMNHISRNLVWDKAVERTLEGYEMALAG
ncbi:glycosyltransferase family 4 protein [Geobacter sp. DSM 9736]|uniref:glycosyltransferase family 4 protein n=1 Tax=Geobacter sp. DSM 9736 TaxID=1277350 RepID=UPI000B50D14E|nr:glycosyltransferase family 4 protein [Geobacter sp. DSM 9736]SNB47965.1 Glycosyltransferase involved in cell wall bisynthesis [Geobacter sp. DSM 9736]